MSEPSFLVETNMCVAILIQLMPSKSPATPHTNNLNG